MKDANTYLARFVLLANTDKNFGLLSDHSVPHHRTAPHLILIILRDHHASASIHRPSVLFN